MDEGRRATPEEPWDLLVIGGGTAGIVGSQTATGLGARVLLVDRNPPGGDCLWTGCVPSKALLAAASAAAQARRAARFGVTAEQVGVDFGLVMDHVRAAIATIEPTDSPQALQAAGVEVRRGEVVLTGPQSAEVDGRPVTFRQALLATGSSPALPDVAGLAAAQPLTTDTVWDLSGLPARLVVLGGGSSGCELGQAFARLGAQVTIIEAADRVLPGEDPRASSALTAALRADGVRVCTGSRVTAVDALHRIVSVQDSDPVPYDALLVATGRRARTANLGLAAAGVAVGNDGSVVVDRLLRTTNPRIWAAGDVTCHPRFTHVAGVHASTAATNALLGLRRRAETRVIPRVTYTDPEIAAVGTSTADPPADSGVTVREWPGTRMDRAVTDSRTDGFTRVAIDARGRIVGATAVSPRAGETLGELCLAVRRRMRTRDLAQTIHPYPTYSDGMWSAAIADVRARLAAPASARAIGGLKALRRRWLSAR